MRTQQMTLLPLKKDVYCVGTYGAEPQKGMQRSIISWVLGGPLVRLTCAHRPTDDGSEPGDFKMLGHKFILRVNIIIECYQRKGP